MYELKHFGMFGRETSEEGVSGLTLLISSLLAIAKGLVKYEQTTLGICIVCCLQGSRRMAGGWGASVNNSAVTEVLAKHISIDLKKNIL